MPERDPDRRAALSALHLGALAGERHVTGADDPTGAGAAAVPGTDPVPASDPGAAPDPGGAADPGAAPDPGVTTYWDSQYLAGGELWGEAPSELVAAAVERLRRLGAAAAELTLLDLGCGYGRDDVALWRALGLAIVGVDGAARGIEMARAALPAGARIEYGCADFVDSARADDLLWQGDDGARGAKARFDVVYASNVYQLLDPPARAAFRAAVRDLLAPGGLFFMSTLSARDPQHAGRGRPVPGEPDSFVERRVPSPLPARGAGRRVRLSRPRAPRRARLRRGTPRRRAPPPRELAARRPRTLTDRGRP